MDLRLVLLSFVAETATSVNSPRYDFLVQVKLLFDLLSEDLLHLVDEVL